MGKPSRDKGARGERELAAALTAEGFDAHRGRQYHGGPDSPDVICKSLSALHFEAKRTERLSIYPALQQAAEDAGGAIPVVAHRRNNHEWVAILRLSDLLSILRESELVSTSAR